MAKTTGMRMTFEMEVDWVEPVPFGEPNLPQGPDWDRLAESLRAVGLSEDAFDWVWSIVVHAVQKRAYFAQFSREGEQPDGITTGYIEVTDDADGNTRFVGRAVMPGEPYMVGGEDDSDC